MMKSIDITKANKEDDELEVSKDANPEIFEVMLQRTFPPKSSTLILISNKPFGWIESLWNHNIRHTFIKDEQNNQ